MKKTVTRKIFAGIMAAVCAVSAAAIIPAATASAASDYGYSSSYRQVAEVNLWGEDWNYSADSLCAKITCDYNWFTKNCLFKATGVTPGVTNAILMAEVSDGKWQNVPMKFIVDNNLNVTSISNGSVYYTYKNTNNNQNQNQSQTNNQSAKTTTYTMTGSDWNYSADSYSATITCDYNWSTSTCKFIIKANYAGVTNAILKAQRSDGRWDNTPIRFTVDNNLNISYQVTGNVFITNY